MASWTAPSGQTNWRELQWTISGKWYGILTDNTGFFTELIYRINTPLVDLTDGVSFPLSDLDDPSDPPMINFRNAFYDSVSGLIFIAPDPERDGLPSDFAVWRVVTVDPAAATWTAAGAGNYLVADYTTQLYDDTAGQSQSLVVAGGAIFLLNTKTGQTVQVRKYLVSDGSLVDTFELTGYEGAVASLVTDGTRLYLASTNTLDSQTYLAWVELDFSAFAVVAPGLANARAQIVVGDYLFVNTTAPNLNRYTKADLAFVDSVSTPAGIFGVTYDTGELLVPYGGTPSAIARMSATALPLAITGTINMTTGSNGRKANRIGDLFIGTSNNPAQLERIAVSDAAAPTIVVRSYFTN